MQTALTDIDGKLYYTKDIDPQAIFNKLEITLSHLFRKNLAVLGGKNYSDCLAQFLVSRGHLRPSMMEIGCGLGDLAINFLKALRLRSYDVERFAMVDISPALLEVQKQRLGSAVQDYILGDCLELSSAVKSFDGMIITNAMLADLRAIYLEPGQSLGTFGITDAGLDSFAKEWVNAQGGAYISVGSLQFLNQLSQVLVPGATAAILEFGATAMNQPALFYNEEGSVHTKCGIDFDQMAAYAKTVGFEVEVSPIEDVLGIDKNQEFLCIDVFTEQKIIAGKIPLTDDLKKARALLPIEAYTRESLRETVVNGGLGFTSDEAERILDALKDCFFTIHDARFDSTNPQTWGYKCALLTKPAQ